VAIREVFTKYNKVPTPPEPAASAVTAYGAVAMNAYVAMLSVDGMAALVTNVTTGDVPMSFENLWQDTGFVNYIVNVSASAPVLMEVNVARDRLQVWEIALSCACSFF
jgi:hypothetical protein